ncbi:hypothetical protein [Alloalcanivorax marinus]|uniref:hypothetical protein n=1 Tax=Alloalcanivorax marinus TaxID=1177169 RepID=UPI0019344DC0|nr:hypothetical protein [Alloalcanivorax marinus]MBL7252173.1 hypothetical protein [Alloalcanivorax marinus]
MARTFALLLFITIAPLAHATETKPARSDCIFRVDLDWSEFAGNKQDALKTLITSVGQAPDMGFNQVPPSATIQGNDQQYLYFQLTDGCGAQRLDSAKKLLSHVERESLPPFRLNTASFSPGLDTIHVQGPWWR